MIGLRSLDRVDFVWNKDPALDRDHDQFDELYDKHLQDGDTTHLPLIEGRVPTIWTLKRLTVPALEHVLGQSGQMKQMVEAVAFGLVTLRNFGGRGDTELRTRKTDVGKRLHPETLDKIFNIEAFPAVGLAVIGLSTLDPTIGQD